jgi:predicted transcriptional regulator
MSKRLHVLLDDEEHTRLQAVAEKEGVTVSELVRRALNRIGREQAAGDQKKKLAAVRAAARHGFPSGPIEQILEEIERGYLGRTYGG